MRQAHICMKDQVSGCEMHMSLVTCADGEDGGVLMGDQGEKKTTWESEGGIARKRGKGEHHAGSSVKVMVRRLLGTN